MSGCTQSYAPLWYLLKFLRKREKNARNRVRQAEPKSEKIHPSKKDFPFTSQRPTDKNYRLKKTPLSPHLVSLVVLLCVLMVALSVEGAIVNGGFENNIISNPGDSISESDLASWTVSPPARTIVRGQGAPNGDPWKLAPYAGSIAATFASDTNATGAGGSLTQAPSPTTDVLKTYNVSMWVANPIQDTANFDNVFSVSWAGTLITLSGSFITEVVLSPKTYIVTPQTDWFQITAVVQGTGVPSDLVISARNNNWATLVDEVIFEETPEPSTVVMLGAGAAIMGLRRRRQQRSL